MDLVLSNGNDTTVTPLSLELGDMLLELVQVVDAVVADADRANLAFLNSLDESLPGALAGSGSAVRCVKKNQVEVVNTGRFQARCDLLLCGLISALDGRNGDFRGEEDLGTRDSTGP